MGIFDSLYTGVSGIKAAEIQINTTGNNISNANAVFYTRQRAVQSSGMSIDRGGLHLGTGTQIDTIKRLHDEHSYYELKKCYYSAKLYKLFRTNFTRSKSKIS